MLTWDAGEDEKSNAVPDKLRELHKETDAGLRPRRYTVGDAIEAVLSRGRALLGTHDLEQHAP